MATTDTLGRDLSGIDDLTPNLTEVDGEAGLAEAIARRWLSDNGTLWYDETHGESILKAINAFARPERLAGALRAQALLDERVEEAIVVVTFDAPTSHLTVRSRITTAEGPFDFTLMHDGVTATLLMGNEV